MTGQARRRAIKTRFVDPDHQGAREVFEAALGGDVEKLEEVLRRSTSIDINWIHRTESDEDEPGEDELDDTESDKDEPGRGENQCGLQTPLHASLLGARPISVELVRVLLEAGADVNLACILQL
ncbi:hypothetical protein GGTG_06081 [Gaeumannomyces tritici R3-111a-1]|uniref:Ankyrin repeat protein n=1 Tax=Gaeumannomyces tritici (strain R3-111a-1) TaxID=644352 RepID=J3NXS6_GAET3|nr:hypothetical protein GGTG_06081 [Gaeumannomyces tritici R3-111a-1]EJT76159.1 hypothetical protein GGTG_06081 [Gaeumannomyces tritici R3-111a-1]